MESITQISHNLGTNQDVSISPPSPSVDHKKAAAIKAYQMTSSRDLSRKVQLDSKITHAVKRWTAHNNIRIEFYTSKDSEEIRVKVIQQGAGGSSFDMSLSTFISSSPAAI